VGSRVDSTELARYVVRIDTSDGKPRGSGFFVAPGWVLTCAHVVEGLQDVVLVPAIGGQPLGGTVAARSQDPPARWKSSLWPFPDLALVSFASGPNQACVLLDVGPPGQDRDCLAWGYARRESTVDPVGSPAALRYVGAEGDGYLTFKADVVLPGMSGAPLVCPDRRAVVGVVTGTRNRQAAMGGWAAPIGVLTNGGPGIPDELQIAGREVLALNRAAVLSDRSKWHAVLPVPEADDALRRSWGNYHKGRRADPADLLLADFRVVPYLFRDAELDEAEAWCLATDPLAVAVLPGLGGSGKTRFAIEMCQRMIERHQWVAGEVRDLDAGMTALVRLPIPRLIVIDYAEAESPAVVRELLDRLRLCATDIAPVRVVLLIRERAGMVATSVATVSAIRADATAAVRRILDEREDSRTATQTLLDGQREHMYGEALARFAQAWETSTPSTPGPDLNGPDYAQPLGVLFAALNAVLSEIHGNDGDARSEPDDPFWGSDPAQRVLAHEEKYWRLTAPSESRDLLRQCVALATLAGAQDDEEADTLLRTLPSLAGDEAADRRAALATWLTELYQGSDRVNPLRPDRLGEALVIAGFLKDMGAAGLHRLLRAGSDHQLARTLTVLTRCAPQSDAALDAVTTALAQSHVTLTLRAETAAQGWTHRVGDASLATSLIGLVSGSLAEGLLARDPEDAGYLRDVWLSLERLGGLAMAVGDGPRARDLFERSLRIAEGLLARDPEDAGYLRDVSVSLERLGLTMAVGDGPRARDLFERSLRIAEGLLARDPENTSYQRDVSVSLNKMGGLAMARGDGPQARELFERSLRIAEWLLAREPQNTSYQRDLSVSLDRLGGLAMAVDVGPQARELFLRSLSIRETLLAREPDDAGYQRDVSVSLTKLGDLAVAAGDGHRAQELFERTLSIRKGLLAREPENAGYQRDVWVSLERLGGLAVAAADRPRAQELFEWSLRIADGLLAREPENTGYQRDLSVSLERLGAMAVAAGDSPRAVKLFESAVAIRRHLADMEHDRVDLAEELGVSLQLLAAATDGAQRSRTGTSA
jgi:tetratricopeptide (TPR) repeat protein